MKSSGYRKKRFAKFLFLVAILIAIPVSALASNAPVIFYTDIIAGPNTGGENNMGCYLTINGKNFGSSQGPSLVKIGEGEVAVYKVWSDTKISVQLGSKVSSGDIIVITLNGSATAPEQFTVRPGDFYFLSTSGSNSTGTKNDITKPYRTANYVMNEMSAGDFMVIRGGTYDLTSGNEGLYNNRWLNLGMGDGHGHTSYTSGTSTTNAITIYGYPGETAIIDWNTYTGSYYRGVTNVSDVDYYAIANLTFDLKHSGSIAILLGWYDSASNNVSYSRLVNITVTGGMAGQTTGCNLVSIQRVDYLKMYGLDVGNQSSKADPKLMSHPIYMSHAYTNADIGWCHMHDNPYGRGFFQIAGDPVTAGYGTNTGVKVHDCIFENLPEEAILCHGGSYEIIVYNNIFNNCNTKQAAGFSPIAFRGAGANNSDYYLYNNTIYTDAEDLSPGGIIQMGYFESYPKSVTLYNNIVYAKSPETNYYQINSNSFSTDKITSDYNVWYGSSDGPPSWAGNHKVETDPKFVDKANGDLRLRSDSPCIGAGSSIVDSYVTKDLRGVSRPQTDSVTGDTEYDIGSYEYTVYPPKNLQIK